MKLFLQSFVLALLATQAQAKGPRWKQEPAPEPAPEPTTDTVSIDLSTSVLGWGYHLENDGLTLPCNKVEPIAAMENAFNTCMADAGLYNYEIMGDWAEGNERTFAGETDALNAETLASGAYELNEYYLKRRLTEQNERELVDCGLCEDYNCIGSGSRFCLGLGCGGCRRRRRLAAGLLNSDLTCTVVQNIAYNCLEAFKALVPKYGWCMGTEEGLGFELRMDLGLDAPCIVQVGSWPY